MGVVSGNFICPSGPGSTRGEKEDVLLTTMVSEGPLESASVPASR